MKAWKERIMQGVFFIAACTSVLAVALICIFLFSNGVPAILQIGIKEFLTGTMWRPGNALFGIAPMILGSMYITLGAILIGVPIGILTAVFVTFYCPKTCYPIVRGGIELLAGIPSVIYGFFGVMVLVPCVREIGRSLKAAGVIETQGNGNSILTAAILLGMMILPTIIGVSESAIRAVPEMYYEGAIALGVTKELSIFQVVLPAAKSGILAAVVLGIGRTIGETMAVIMIAGNQPRIPESVFEGVRTMTANVVMEMGYATGMHRQALIGTAVVLFVFILIINFTVAWLKRRTEDEQK